jgi:hypothetical protein
MAPDVPRPRRSPVCTRGRVACALAALLALSMPVVVPSDGQAAGPRIGAADLHVDTILADDDREINLSLSQTQGDCGGTALNGQICLRYSVEVDDTEVEAGYGVIAPSALKVSGSSITLATNTAADPGFHLPVGHGGALSIRWKEAPGARSMTAHGRTSTLLPATVQGTVLGYALTGTIVQADVLIYK